MTDDLHTACRELVESWRESEVEQTLNHAELAEQEAFETCINDLENILDEHDQLDPEVKQLVAMMEDAT